MTSVAATALFSGSATAVAQAGGGTQAPAVSGGAQYGIADPIASRPPSLTVRAFRVSPTTLAAGATSARVWFRVDGGAPSVIVRFAILSAERRTIRRVVLRRPTGRRYSRGISLPAGLDPGSYVATLQATDARARGRALRARAASTRVALQVSVPAPPPPPASPPPTPAPPAPEPAPPATAPVTGGVFPVRGPFSFGFEGARFGADRGGRLHRGQDVVAAEGTPLVSPRAGVVHWRAFQASGAGHYVVIREPDGRDHVFMHMRDASPLAPGTRVAAGQLIGAVGNSGGSSGPHLHFELWPQGWFSSPSSQPIDPLPQLRAWAGLAAG